MIWWLIRKTVLAVTGGERQDRALSVAYVAME
jgi:hypothetical protein